MHSVHENLLKTKAKFYTLCLHKYLTACEHTFYYPLGHIILKMQVFVELYFEFAFENSWNFFVFFCVVIKADVNDV